jgi:hypothetical protein
VSPTEKLVATPALLITPFLHLRENSPEMPNYANIIWLYSERNACFKLTNLLKSMKRTLVIVLFPLLLLGACAPSDSGSSDQPSSGDLSGLVSLGADGSATLQGRFGSTFYCQGNKSMGLVVPVVFRGIRMEVLIPLTVPMDTGIQSTRGSWSTVCELFEDSPQARLNGAFGPGAFGPLETLEVRFAVVDRELRALSLRGTGSFEAPDPIAMDGFYHENWMTSKRLVGAPGESTLWSKERLVMDLSLSHQLHGAPVSLSVPVVLTPKTKLNTRNNTTGVGIVDLFSSGPVHHGWSIARIEFRIREGEIHADRITPIELSETSSSSG